MAETGLDDSGTPHPTAAVPSDEPSEATAARSSADEPAASRPREFGWRQGLLLGAGVLIAVYAVAEVTAWLPALRDGLEHLPVTIAVLVVGTLAVLGGLARGSRRR